MNHLLAAASSIFRFIAEQLPWFLDRRMIWGAVLGWLICSGYSLIRNAANHHGPGVVYIGEFAEIEKNVSESEYKTHNYVGGSMMIGLGVIDIGQDMSVPQIVVSIRIGAL